jgi:hypothetical protein
MLYRTRTFVCSKIQREHIIANYGNNVEFVDIHPDGKESNRYTLKGQDLKELMLLLK